MNSYIRKLRLKEIPTNTQKRNIFKKVGFEEIKTYYSTFPQLSKEELQKLKEKLYSETGEQDPILFFKTFQVPEKYSKYKDIFIIAYAKDQIHRLEDIEPIFVPMLNDYFLLHRNRKLKSEHQNILNVIKKYDLETLLSEYQNELDDLNEKFGKRSEISDYLKNLSTHKDEVEIVRDDELATILIPKTQDASCYWGNNTKWCVSAKEKNRFDDYTKDGPLHFIIPKNPVYSLEKYAYHHPTQNYMNEKDIHVNPIEIFKRFNLLNEISNIPIIPVNEFKENRELILEYNPNIEISTVNASDLKEIPEITKLEIVWTEDESYGTDRLSEELSYGKNLKTLILEFPTNTITLDTVCTLVNLETLEINAYIESIPKEISNLVNLRKLVINVNGDNPVVLDLNDITKKLTYLQLQTFKLIGEIDFPNVQKLLLDYCGLTDFKFEKFTHLVELSLIGNEINNLPDVIGNYSNLKELSLDKNNITHIPNSINNCINLQQFSIDKNKIKKFPILKLPNLTDFKASNCNLRVIPLKCPKIKFITVNSNRILDISNICEFKELFQLFITRNKIEKIPDCVLELPKLNGIDISNNPIVYIPESIGDTNINHLILINTQLEDIPESILNIQKRGQISIYGTPFSKRDSPLLTEIKRIQTLKYDLED